MTLNSPIRSGISAIGDVPWGTHICQFYRSQQDLIDILVPYFEAGLRNKELCVWVTSEPLDAARAAAALRNVVPDLDRAVEQKQIEIIPHQDWYNQSGRFDSRHVISVFERKLGEAVARGFSGARVSGNLFWVGCDEWAPCVEYEAAVEDIVRESRTLAVCSYSLEQCDGLAVLDVVRNHQYSIAKMGGEWQVIDKPVDDRFLAELQRSEERYRVLFNTMTEGFVYCEVIYGPDGRAIDYRYLEVNEAYARHMGLARSEMLGRTLLEMFPNRKHPLLEALGRVARTGKPTTFESYDDRVRKWFENYAYSPRKGYFARSLRDITRRKEAEQIKDDFIGLVSHELRTQLTVIKGALHTAMTKDVSEGEKDALLKDAAWGTDGISDVVSSVDTLLDLPYLYPVLLDITGTVEARLARFRTRFPENRFSVDVAPGLTATADQRSIELVLDNLVSNAIKYSPEGGKVHISATEKQQTVVVSVRDCRTDQSQGNDGGLPLPIQELEVSGRWSANQDVGLGLVVCRRIVEAHGGQMWADPDPGRGLTFHFTLPIGIRR